MSLGQCAEQAKVLLAEIHGLLDGFKQLSDAIDEQGEHMSLDVSVPLNCVLPAGPQTTFGSVSIKLDRDACLDAVALTGREILDRWKQLQSVANEAVASCEQAFTVYDAPEAQEGAPVAAEGTQPPG